MGNVIATVREWNYHLFEEKIKEWPGEWMLIKHPDELSLERIRQIEPQYIFFPHWNEKVSEEILKICPCICFHETDVPCGRGGSPIQNLIIRGHRETVVSALRMLPELDAGPVYLKRKVSLEGLAEEIYIRISEIIAEMILYITTNNPEPVSQKGEITFFKRRKPEQSLISIEINSLNELFDFLRMLDADGYPRAFLNYGSFKFEFSRPALRTGKIIADVTITLKSNEER